MIVKYLCDITFDLMPGLRRVEWGNLWERPFSEGSAFQWAVFASLLAELEKQGWTVELPESLINSHAGSYLLWNSVPRQHSSQTGHFLESTVSLDTRFLASLTPRATITKDNLRYSLYREGCSYHQLTATTAYAERPDIVIAEGAPIKVIIDQDSAEIIATYSSAALGSFVCTLAIRSSATLPIRKWEPAKPSPIEIAAVIECTTKKTTKVLEAQLNAYRNVFNTPESKPTILTASYQKMLGENIFCVSPVELSRDLLEENLLATSRNILGLIAF